MFLVGNRQVTRVRGEHDLMNADFWRGTAREIMFRNYAKHDWPHEEPDSQFTRVLHSVPGRSTHIYVAVRAVQVGAATAKRVSSLHHCMRNGRLEVPGGFTANTERGAERVDTSIGRA
jgi:hypothetical protein